MAADQVPATGVRKAVSADVEDMRRIAEAAYAPYVPRLGRKPAPMTADFAAAVADGQAYVLDGDAGIAGFIVTFEKDAGQFIENVAVDPARHGGGYGRRLLDFAEHEAARRRLGRLFLYTNIHMRENLDFYPKLGYLETHRVHEDGFDRVYFEKRVFP